MSEKSPAVVQTNDYLDAVQKHLDVRISNGEPICLLDSVRRSRMRSLYGDLRDIFKATGAAARADVSSRKGDNLQQVLFGKVDDFQLAIKTGFLLGDRVVLWDYLSSAALRWAKNAATTRPEEVAVVATNLVSLLPVVKGGRVVILAHPTEWSPDARLAVKEVAERTTLTPELAGLAATLAVVQELTLHPYTIAENNRTFRRLLAKQPAKMRKYDYDTLLAGLLSARLLSDERFDYFVDAPLERIPEVVEADQDFYRQFRERLMGGGLDEAEFRVGVLAKEIDKIVISRNAQIREMAYDWATFGGVLAGVISFLSAASAANPLLPMAGGLIGLSATLLRLFTRQQTNAGVIGSVFRKLKHDYAERTEAFDTALLQTSDRSDWASDYYRSVPRGVGKHVAMNTQATDDLLGGPGDYVEGYLYALFDVSPKGFWRQIETAFEDFDSVESWTSCIPEFARRSDMPATVIDAMLNYVVRLYTTNLPENEKNSTLGDSLLTQALTELAESKKYRALLTKRIRHRIKAADKDSRQQVQQCMAWAFGGSIPDWIALSRSI